MDIPGAEAVAELPHSPGAIPAFPRRAELPAAAGGFSPGLGADSSELVTSYSEGCLVFSLFKVPKCPPAWS